MFKMNIISIRKHFADSYVVNDVACMCRSVITRGHTIFMTRCYPLNNSDVT